MTSLHVLNALLQKAALSTEGEDAFFNAMLDATLYAHVPIDQIPGRVRFIQFVRPDNGQTVLPIFTDRQKAMVALRPEEAILAMKGRELLELTRGATLMPNPNEDRCALYPKEVDALLAGKSLAPYAVETLTRSEQVAVRKPTVPTEAIREALRPIYASEPNVSAAYLVEIARGANHDERSLLIGAVVTEEATERVLRGALLALQSVAPTLPLPLLLGSLAPHLPLGLYDKGVRVYP